MLVKWKKATTDFRKSSKDFEKKSLTDTLSANADISGFANKISLNIFISDICTIKSIAISILRIGTTAKLSYCR